MSPARYRLHLLRVVFGLFAAVLCSLPDIRTPLGVPVEASLSEERRNPHGAISLGSLLRAAEEREEALDDVTLAGRQLRMQTGPALPAGVRISSAPEAARYSGSHFPTGPPHA